MAGCLLAAMIVFSLLSNVSWLYQQYAYALSGLCACIAAVLLFGNLRSSAKIQVTTLLLIGGVLLFIAHQRGGSFSLMEAISRNTLLLSMILSVGFLRLLLDLETSDAPLPRGRKAFLNTLLSLGFFGSVINISAPIMLCDRISRDRPIDLFTARAASLIFCSCSAWSPYFAGAALILTVVHGVDLLTVMITGAPFLLITISAVYWVSVLYSPERVNTFLGYPISLSIMWVPVALTVAVVSTQALLPEMPILVAICLSALVLTIIGLMFKRGRQESTSTLREHVRNGLPKSANELLLFVSAGVLATGLTAYVNVSQFELSLTEYGYSTACMTLAAMIVISAAGIHPIIQISAFTPLLLPINPDPELLASTFLFAWALGTAASPLSGTHLVFQGRYGISAWKGAVQNWRFVGVLYFAACGLLGMQVMLT